MSTFSDKFRDTVLNSGVSVTELAEQSGVSAAMLYKIQTGKRLPDSLETLKALLELLHCALPRKRELIREYLITKVGFCRYNSIQALKSMLKDFTPPIECTMVEPYREFVVPDPVIHGEGNVNAAIQQLLLFETQMSGGSAQLFLDLRFRHSFSAIAQILGRCREDFGTLTHLFCLKATASEESVHNNMIIFRDVLPMMSRMPHYDPRYCYLPEPNDGTVPYPYYLITSQGVLLIDESFSSALFLEDGRVRQQFYNRFCALSENFASCLRAGKASMETYFSGFHQLIGQHGNSDARVEIIVAVPCFLPCADISTACTYLPEEFLQRPDIMGIAQEYFEGAAFGGYETFYTLGGLEHVINTGEMMELQGDFVPRIKREHVLAWLEEFLRRARAGMIVPRVFKTDFIPVSTHFSMVLRDSELMLYCESGERNTVFSNLAENTMAIVVRDYVAYAEMLGDVYSVEESIALTEQVLKKYRQ